MPKAKPYSDQKNWSNTYLTDPSVVKALGPFDTDPCCPPAMPWKTAKRMFSHEKLQRGDKTRGALWPLDGLKAPWKGRVFMNPPYRGVTRWAKRFAEHGDGIALLNGRSTETVATQIIMDASCAILFPRGRLVFYKVDGKPWAGRWFPSLLVAMTPFDARKLEALAKTIGGQVYYKKNRKAK